jgi:hypothetical protein
MKCCELGDRRPMNKPHQANRWKRFWNLPRYEKTLLFRASALLPLTNVCLRVAGFRRSKRLLEHLGVSGKATVAASTAEQLVAAERVARMVSVAEQWTFSSPTCLEKSLVLWRLLRRQGLSAQLHIGARKNDQALEAHAWVECQGVVLNDTAEVHRHYSRFDAPIAADEAEKQ